MYKYILIIILVFFFITSGRLSQDNIQLSPQQSKVVTTLSYNIWGLPIWLPKVGFNSRFKKIVRKINMESFDILCLQECFSSRARDILMKNIHSSYNIFSEYICNEQRVPFLKMDCHGGLLTLSRFPIVEELFFSFPANDSMKLTELIGKKGVMISYIVDELKDTVAVVNTHLYAGQLHKDEQQRLLQIQFIHGILEEYDVYRFPVIFMGDLNIIHPEIAFSNSRECSTVYDYIRDTMLFKDTAPTLLNHHFTIDYRRNGYCNRKDGIQKLDYCFVRDHSDTNFRIVDKRSIFGEENSYSDHLAWRTDLIWEKDRDVKEFDFTQENSLELESTVN